MLTWLRCSPQAEVTVCSSSLCSLLQSAAQGKTTKHTIFTKAGNRWSLLQRPADQSTANDWDRARRLLPMAAAPHSTAQLTPGQTFGFCPLGQNKMKFQQVVTTTAVFEAFSHLDGGHQSASTRHTSAGLIQSIPWKLVLLTGADLQCSLSTPPN